MLQQVLRRVLTGLAVMWGVATLVFFLVRAAPGDPARLVLGPTATEAQVAAQRERLGLDRPVTAQYAAWLGQLLSGDLGTSIGTGRPVRAMLSDAWPATALLVSISLLLSYLLGVALGVAQAAWHGSRTDTALSVASVALHAMPGYWLGLVLIMVFAYGLRILPAFGASGVDREFLSGWGRLVDTLRHAALPVTTLTIIGIGGIARYVRGAMAEVRRHRYLTVAAARGLDRRAVLLRHALPNALIPVLVLLGLSLPALFSGAVFVEAIFAWPGVGRVLVEAVQARDYPVVLAATTISAGLVVAGSVLADVLVTLADPRVRDATNG